MKKILIICIAFIHLSFNNQKLDEATFDFWVGTWEVSWKNQDGTVVKGTNTIAKILDGKVTQENFEDPTTKFKGTSISVFNPTTQNWHQAWADNSGGYFDFIGDIIDGNPAFKTKMVKKYGKKGIQRMVFKNIKKDSFTWIWEGTQDGGKTWNELWKISYNRLEN